MCRICACLACCTPAPSADSRCATCVVVAVPPSVIRLTCNEPVQPIGRGIRVVAPSGSVVVPGVHMGPLELPWHPVFMKEARIIPSLGYCRHNGRHEMADAAAMFELSAPVSLESRVKLRFHDVERVGEDLRILARFEGVS